MSGIEAASIEVRPLHEALQAGDRTAWGAFAHACAAADGLEPHPSLGSCAGCRSPWTPALGPVGLIEAVVDVRRLTGLLCGACLARDDVAAMLERILRESLPQGARVVERHFVHDGPAGHA